jgi:hypothetical protein
MGIATGVAAMAKALARQAEDQERELVGLRQRAVTASLLC